MENENEAGIKLFNRLNANVQYILTNAQRRHRAFPPKMQKLIIETWKQILATNGAEPITPEEFENWVTNKEIEYSEYTDSEKWWLVTDEDWKSLDKDFNPKYGSRFPDESRYYFGGFEIPRNSK